MNKISQTIKESCFSCKNIAQISIWMILVVSKCSINDVKSLISLIFRGPQTPHVTTIFEKILQTILFYANKSACHIFGTICDTFRLPNKTEISYTGGLRIVRIRLVGSPVLYELKIVLFCPNSLI